MKKIMFLMALISIVSSAEISVINSGNTKNISVNSTSTDNMRVSGDGAYKSGGNPDYMDPAKFLNGYSIKNGLIFENKHIINLDGWYNSGLLVTNGGIAGNSGTINVNGTGGIGLFTGDGTGQLVNIQSGIINVSNSGKGMASAGWPYYNFTGKLRNDGSIIVNGSGTGISVGGNVDVQGGTAINNGKIRLNGGGSSTGVYVAGYNTFTNNGEISGTTTGAEQSNLISANNQAQIINSAGGIIRGTNNTTGIYITNSYSSHKSTVINDGLIETENGNGIFSVSTDVINNGVINSKTTGIQSTMYAGNFPVGTVLNNGTVKVQENGTGINGVASIVRNDGIMSIEGNNATGILVYSPAASVAAQLINNADIAADQNKQNVILLRIIGNGAAGNNDANLYNSAHLTVEGDNSTAIYSQSGANIHNSGSITVNNGAGIVLRNSSVNAGDNTGTITINGSGTGILADMANSNVINDGEINLNANGTGIYIASGNKGENRNNINIAGTGATGVYVSGQETEFTNGGSILVGENNTGLKVTAGGTLLNKGDMYLTGNNSVGIEVSDNGRLYVNTGNITLENGTGIRILNSMYDNRNEGMLYVTGTTGIGIESAGSNVTNAGTIYTGSYENKGIAAYGSNVENTGKIYGMSAAGIYANYSRILNFGSVDMFGSGTGIKSEGSSIINTAGAMINAEYGSGIEAVNSNVENQGMINVMNGSGISSLDSYVLNSGKIIGGDRGIYAENNRETINTGEINSRIGVEITAGSNEYSGHFLNSGKISGSDYAIKFNNGSNVLELRDGTEINGKIQGSTEDNTVIVNGNVKLEELRDFSKLVTKGNSILEGNVYLKPTENENYYTEAFGNAKNLSNIHEETNLGKLIVNGTVNIGVDYDGIINETEKTGKIIAESVNLQNGNIILNNAGRTDKSITDESGLMNNGDQIRVKSIIISNKQQAVDPQFKFNTSGNMTAGEGWVSETVSRIENGVTVLDELYTNVKTLPPVPADDNGNKPEDGQKEDENTPEEKPEDEKKEDQNIPEENQGDNKEEEKIIPEKENADDENKKDNSEITVDPKFSEQKPKNISTVKMNYVPRNRVDLDNMNKITSVSEKILDTGINIKAGESTVSFEYIGNRGNTDFNENSAHNYNYDAKADGINGSILYKANENAAVGITLGYIDNDVTYSNNDTEKINSSNINIFGRYQAGNFIFDAYAGYGYNRHSQEIDWLGAGIKESRYDSNVVKTGISIGYNQKLNNSGIVLRPDFGLEYISVYEGTIRTEDMADISSAKGDGTAGKIKLSIMNTEGKFKWNAGIGFERNFTDTYHKEREMVNNYKMAELDYGQNNLSGNIDINYEMTDKVTFKAGYEYENNENYENHNFKAGISYTLDK